MNLQAKQKPILFTDAMVRAILEGRKTQTRRMAGNIKHRIIKGDDGNWYDADGVSPGRLIGCRQGAPGDRLWVKEGVIKIGHARTGKNGQYLWPTFANDERSKRWFASECAYTADLKASDPLYLGTYGTLNKMFMPRWASRITLEIKSVRAERVQDISEADAMAEGCEHSNRPGMDVDINGESWNGAYRRAYRNLWNSINGPGSWDANPFCWVIEFARVGGGQ